MSEHEIFCAVDEPAEIGGGLRQWDGTQISWRNVDVRYPNADFGDAMQYTKQLIEQHCGLKIEIRTARGANLLAYLVRIDGPQGVLARHYLPAAPSPLYQSRRGEYDRGERSWFGQRELNQVVKHETLHGVGLGHYNEESSVQNSRLNFDWIGKLDPWTIDQLQKRYGLPEGNGSGGKLTWQEYERIVNDFASQLLARTEAS